ncbi:MAG: OmpH family outer membrane protein [Bryobacteraceae bacterium]|nr:OmpH family outer membrane protein [Bryobacteraceae bacterium]
MKIQAFAVMVLALGTAVSGNAQAPASKVGIINIQAAIISTKDGKKAAADLEAKFGPKRKEMEAKQAEINSLRDQLQKGQNTLSEEAKQKLVREIDSKTKAFNRAAEDAQAELEQEQQKIFNQLGQRMLAVLDKYAKDNSYALILDVSQQPNPVMFAANGIDVTQEVIKLYDANSSGPASSNTPASTPSTAPAAPPKPAGAQPKPAGAK